MKVIFTPITILYAGESKGVAKITYTGWDGHKKQMPEAKNTAKIDALERFANENFSKSRFKDYMQAKNSILSNIGELGNLRAIFIEIHMAILDNRNLTFKMKKLMEKYETKTNFKLDWVDVSHFKLER